MWWKSLYLASWGIRSLHRKLCRYLTICRITSRKKYCWVSLMGNSCLWIILNSNMHKNYFSVWLHYFWGSAPFAFPCEATEVFVLLLTTTYTVISITGFLPKPKYSQTPSEQVFRDFSKLEGISGRAIFSVFLFAESVKGSAANQAKGSRRIACPELFRKVYLFAERFWRSRNSPFFSKHNLVFETLWVLAQCNFNDSAGELCLEELRLSWLSWRLLQCNISVRLSLNPHGAAKLNSADGH